MAEGDDRGLLRRLGVALVALVLANFAAIGVTLLAGVPPAAAVRSTGIFCPAYVLRKCDNDSWYYLFLAYDRWQRAPARGIYSLFFEDKEKFLYPPPSILPVVGLRPASVEELQRFMDGPSRAGVIAALWACLAIFELSRDKARPHGGGVSARWCMRAVLVGFGLTYFPLQYAHALGQAQVFLNVLAALALLAFLRGHERLTGALFALAALVKPQFGLVLLWAVVRREWRLSFGFAVVFSSGLLASLWVFGLPDHLRYLDLLSFLSRHGEAFWTNQSVNGLLNRLLGNGDALTWRDHEYPPYNRLVHLGTILSSAAILALALWPRGARRDGGGGRVSDLLVVMAAMVLASPVAWEHHYGVLLPVFAAVLPRLWYGGSAGGRGLAVLALAYFLVANVYRRPEVFFWNPLLGVLGSSRLLGGLLLMGLLVRLREEPASAQLDRPRLGESPMQGSRLSPRG